jgi:hypothetical protein
VKAVRIEERRVELARDNLADDRLAAAGDPHRDDDAGAFRR